MKVKQKEKLSQIMKLRWKYARIIAEKYLFFGSPENVMYYAAPVIKEEGLKKLAVGRNDKAKRKLVSDCSEIMTRVNRSEKIQQEIENHNKRIEQRQSYYKKEQKEIEDNPVDQIKIALWFIKKVGGIESANKAFSAALQVMETK